jgi:hypothetical protein
MLAQDTQAVSPWPHGSQPAASRGPSSGKHGQVLADGAPFGNAAIDQP